MRLCNTYYGWISELHDSGFNIYQAPMYAACLGPLAHAVTSSCCLLSSMIGWQTSRPMDNRITLHICNLKWNRFIFPGHEQRIILYQVNDIRVSKSYNQNILHLWINNQAFYPRHPWLLIWELIGPSCTGIHKHLSIVRGRDKMTAIFLATFSNAFSWMKVHESRLRFPLNMFLRVQLTILQHWRLQANDRFSHYKDKIHWNIIQNTNIFLAIWNVDYKM